MARVQNFLCIVFYASNVCHSSVVDVGGRIRALPLHTPVRILNRAVSLRSEKLRLYELRSELTTCSLS